MNNPIEIWKIFEDDHLVTYACGDMGLYKTRAQGKVVFFKKTGDIYLVETIGRSIPKEKYDRFYLPKIRAVLNDYRNSGAYPDKKDISDLTVVERTNENTPVAKAGPQQWRKPVNADAIKNKLNNVLISFFASTPGGYMELTGTGFIVVASGRNAMVMTAADIFYSAGLVPKHNRPYPPMGLSEFQVHAGKFFPVNTEKISAIYGSGNEVVSCIIKGVSIIPELNIAVCAIEFQYGYSGPNFSYKIGLDSRPPKKGDEVAAIGFSKIKINTQNLLKNKGGLHSELMRNMEMRIGKVTGVFNNGSKQAGWPCFEATIPIDPGMNGGPVLPFSVTEPNMNACAVISKDLSPQAAFKSFSTPGHSIMAMIWPSFLLPFRTALKTDPRPTESTLLELSQKGIIKDKGAAHKNTRIVKKDHQILAISRKDPIHPR